MPNQQGFTLIELMMAMAVFSFMFTIILIGFLGVVRTHEAGVVQRSTQQNARLAIDQISKSTQQAATVDVTVTTAATATTSEIDRICLASSGQNIGLEVIPVTVGTTTVQSLTLKVYSKPNCVTADLLSTTRLTDNTVTVTQFQNTKLDGGTGMSLGALTTKLSVASAYGIDFLDPLTLQTSCKPGTGSQFCTVTTMLSTSALKGGLQ